MRDLVPCEQAREALFAAVEPFLDGAARSLPAEAAALRVLLLLQVHPTMVRLVLVGRDRALEAVRLSEPELPNADAIAEAVERFVAGGLSAIPPAVVGAVFETAAPPGAGFAVLLDPLTGSARCVVMRAGLGMERAVELFAIVPEAETLH